MLKFKKSIQKNWIFTPNIFIVLVYRILIMMLLFSICRLGFYLFNQDMFPEIGFAEIVKIFIGGLKFDLSGVLYFNLFFLFFQVIPFEFRYNKLYQSVLKYLYFLLNGVALSLNMADFVYYRFSLKRATSEVFESFANEQNKATLTFQFMSDYWQATILWLAVLAMMIYLYDRIKLALPQPKNRISYHTINIILMPVIIGLTVAGLRGGFRHSTRPITISHAAKYTENPRNVAIVLNTPFSILRTFNKKTLKKPEYFNEQALDSLYRPVYTPAPKGKFKNKNVVIIILESFAREYIGALNTDLDNGDYKGFTPFTDSLISVSKTYTITLANGRKSIDAMPSILASIPSLETPYTISHYSNNDINGLPSLLKEKGYYSAFFHGAPNGSMGFDSFAKMAGFDDYFGLNEYPGTNDFDGIWGVWDEEFFQYFARKTGELQEPFMLSIFSVSSHHPFKLPEKHEGNFAEGPHPITKVVSYTDYALRKYFETARKMPWFNNTIFVITADHTNEPLHDEYRNSFGYYAIPILFYEPGNKKLRGMETKIAQQIDIMPSILNYMNYDNEYVAFGNDLFNNSSNNVAFNTAGSTYHLYMQDHLMEMIDGEPVGLYNFSKDRLLKENILNEEIEIRDKMKSKLRAIIQSYNTRLIENRMTIIKEREVIAPSP